MGITLEYQQVKHLVLRRGRFLSGPDMAAKANVAVLGAGAAMRLFSYEDPVEQSVLLGNSAYRVVGVLDVQDSGGATPGAIGHQDFNNDIYIPLSAARSRFGELQMIVRAGSRDFERTQLSEITLMLHDETLVTQTAAMARKLLKQNHPEKEDYEVQVPLELLRQAEHEKRIWNLVLGSIAGISLLVGGIGIMNIMLASVTERTREIGIRRAIGAKRRQIIGQFLIETVVLSSVGGLIGIALGLLIPRVISLATGMPTVVPAYGVVLSLCISLAVGIVFGLYPAKRAAGLDPIVALRHE
jgi:putative ABC transport system permease protein